MTRELDEKVARILGWNTSNERGFWVHPHYPDNWHSYPWRYSTDWLRVPDMLAWFNDRKIELVLGTNPKSTNWTHWEAEAIPEPPGQFHTARGATLPEALANLLVAVAESKEKGK